MPVSERTFICGKCEMKIDRDINASQNILKRATPGHSQWLPSKMEGGESQAHKDDARPSAWKADADEVGTTFGASR